MNSSDFINAVIYAYIICGLGLRYCLGEIGAAQGPNTSLSVLDKLMVVLYKRLALESVGPVSPVVEIV